MKTTEMCLGVWLQLLLLMHFVSSPQPQSTAQPNLRTCLWQHHSWSREIYLWWADRCGTCDMLMPCASFIRLRCCCVTGFYQKIGCLCAGKRRRKKKKDHVQVCMFTWTHCEDRNKTSTRWCGVGSFGVNAVASPRLYHTLCRFFLSPSLKINSKVWLNVKKIGKRVKSSANLCCSLSFSHVWQQFNQFAKRVSSRNPITPTKHHESSEGKLKVYCVLRSEIDLTKLAMNLAVQWWHLLSRGSVARLNEMFCYCCYYFCYISSHAFGIWPTMVPCCKGRTLIYSYKVLNKSKIIFLWLSQSHLLYSVVLVESVLVFF